MDDNAHLGQCSDGSSGNALINDAGATIVHNGPQQANILVPVQDNGAVTVGGGTLSLPTFAPALSSTLTVGVSATPAQLSVSGPTALKGTLAIQTKAGYLPPLGKKVAILTATSRSGTFATVTGTQMTGEHWVVSYTATSVILKAVSG